MATDITMPRPPPLRSSLMGTSARGSLFASSIQQQQVLEGPGSANASTPPAGSLLQTSPSFVSRAGGASTDLPRLRALNSSGRFSESGGGNADKSGSRNSSSFGSARASETGDGLKAPGRPSPHPGMRRSSTMIGATRLGSVGMDAAASSGPSSGSNLLAPSPPSASRDAGSGRDRAATSLSQEKHALLLNKRRLEALLSKVLEQQQQWQQAAAVPTNRPGSPPEAEEEATGSSMWPAAGSSIMSARGAVGGSPGAAALRSQIIKALDDSALLDKQLTSSSPTAASAQAGGSATGSFATVDTDARVRELTAVLEGMKLEHEVALSRMEGELKYRNTQASAATSSLQKQLGEAEEEMASLRRQLAAAEGRIHNMSATESQLRRQVQDLSGGLEGSRTEMAALKDLIGMDKTTLHTVVGMLKDQLKDAHEAGAAKSQRISELEYQIVRRDTLLAEATQQRLVAEEKATALSAAAGSGGGAGAQGATGDAFVVVGAARSSCSGAGNGNGNGNGAAARRLTLGVLGESFSGEELMMMPGAGVMGGGKAATVGGYNVYHSSAGQLVFD